jgi:haloalkane dehalogenase
MTPDWVDRQLYPFEPRRFAVDGHAMSYVDEGSGAPVVLVHGTPTWSFLWRDAIRALSVGHRVVAPDHLGFGLSDKPADADYTPAAHARRLQALIEHLGLEVVTLVVHDFGGPIGLHHALTRPQSVARVVLMNTWLWSNEGDRSVEGASRLFASPLGRLLYLRLNLSPRALLPSAFADRRRLGRDVHAHYLAPFADPSQRLAPWVLARELTASNAWYEELWARRGLLADKPALVLWGMKDRPMPPRHLERWRQALPHAQVVELPEAGHFVTEEAGPAVSESLAAFLDSGTADHYRDGRPGPTLGHATGGAAARGAAGVARRSLA